MTAMRTRRLLLTFMLIGCSACDAERVPDGPPPESDPIDRHAHAEDLYFELVRLHSLGLVSDERMEAMNATLDRLEVDPDAAEREHAAREAIASMLRRTLGELKRSDPELSDAMEAREYARRLHRRGVVAAQDLGEVTLVVAGLLGVPTSKGELAFVVLLPAGGYLVGKLVNVALKRAIFLLRRARSLDDVMMASDRLGLEFSSARNSSELAGIIGGRPVDDTLLARIKAVSERQGAGAVSKLRLVGPNTWESSGGLIYGPDKMLGNRVQHVLAHTFPNPSKRVHSVFSVEKSEVLGLVDEAWRMKGTALPGDPGTFVVSIGRTVGTTGETGVKIIVRPGTNQIITAYPVKP